MRIALSLCIVQFFNGIGMRGVHSLILPDEAPKLTNIIITLIHQMDQIQVSKGTVISIR